MHMTREGHAIKPPDRLTYTPAVELRYLGKMAELDHIELANIYISLRSMEIASNSKPLGIRDYYCYSELNYLHYH